jgi:hypothetical protein
MPKKFSLENMPTLPDPDYLIVPADVILGIDADRRVKLALLYFCAQPTGAYDGSIQTLADVAEYAYDDTRAALLRLERNGIMSVSRENGKPSTYRLTNERFGYLSEDGRVCWCNAPAQSVA